VFPKWTNGLRTAVLLLVLGGGAYAGGIVYFGFSPIATDVGYMPQQPIPYSHALHVGRLGLDCRYCHTTVEESAHASVPPLKTCIGCHSSIRREEDPRARKLVAEMIDAYEKGRAIKWVKVHDLPDYAYFSHAAHVRRGVGCISCHGRVDRMEVVYQHEPLSMGWCLECHRNPEQHLRPVEEVTNMTWSPPGGQSPADYGLELKAASQIKPSQDCSTCHR
jgi:hypothetical protein